MQVNLAYGRLDRRLATFGLAALVLAGVGVWFAADLLLRPLRRLRAVTSRIAEDEDLDRRVRVTLMPPREDAGPALHVDDDGPGVPEEERERVFEPFARVNGTTASGSGLGLALVAQQSRAHCATVEIERSPLGGARFTVRFRAAASTAAEGRLQG